MGRWEEQANNPFPHSIETCSMLEFFCCCSVHRQRLYNILLEIKKKDIVIEMYLTWINTQMTIFSAVILINLQRTKIQYGEYSTKTQASSHNVRVIL